MKRFACVLSVLFLTAGTGLHASNVKPEASARNIDIVLCLDVSGSMNGLVDSAKSKLWAIVNQMGSLQPAPNLRVGLYSYGHSTYRQQDGWVRKEADLTLDLDEVYKKLSDLKLGGGTEYVARVCRDAIADQPWSDDKEALKIIFVCGNEPASQDPQVTLKDVADKAKTKGIIINPIFCGRAEHHDAKDWKELAGLAEGCFASIDQNKAMLAIATPMDKELAELSAKINDTYVAYGADGKGMDAQMKQRAQDANASNAAPGAAAERAVTKASGVYRNEQWDLVDRMNRDKDFDVNKLKDEELSEEMRKLKPEERAAFLKKKNEDRVELQKKISELGVQRQQFIDEEMKKRKTDGDKGFDEAIKAALKEQAARKGIKIEDK